MTHVRLWQARCVPGRIDEAAAWVQQRVAAEALEAGAHTAEVFRGDGAVLLLTRWPTVTPWVEPVADPALVVRAHGSAYASLGDR